MAAPQVNVGAMVLELNADTVQLEASIQASESLLQRFSKTMEDVSNYTTSWTVTAQKFSMISVGIKNAYEFTKGFLTGAINQFTQFGDQLDKMSLRTGMAASDLSRLKFAAEQCGGSIDSLGDGLKEMNNKLQAAEMGNVGEIEKFQNLGLDPEQLVNMEVKERLFTIADAFQRCQSETEKTRFALELFGDAGYKLLPMLQLGRAGMEELMEEADRLGISISDEDVAAAAQMTDEINRLTTAYQSITRNLLANASETIIGWMETIRNIGQTVGQFMKDHDILCRGIVRIGSLIIGLGAPIVAVSAIIGVVGAAMLGWIAGISLFIGGVMMVAERINLEANAFDELAEKQHRATEEGEKFLAMQDRQRQAEDQKIRRLMELQQKERLNNSEMDEAEKLIAGLTQKYGDLGIHLDKTTGKLTGAAEAQKKMNAMMREAAIMDVEAQIAKLQAEKATFANQATAKGETRFSIFALATDAAGITNYQGQVLQEVAQALSQQNAAGQQIQALQKRLDALKLGEKEAILGGEELPDLLPSSESLAEEQERLDQMDRIAGQFFSLKKQLDASLISGFFDEQSPFEKQLEDIEKCQDGYIALCQEVAKYSREMAKLVETEKSRAAYLAVAEKAEKQMKQAKEQVENDKQQAYMRENERLDEEAKKARLADDLEAQDNLSKALLQGSLEDVRKAQKEVDEAEKKARDLSVKAADERRYNAELAEANAAQTYLKTRKEKGENHAETIRAKETWVEAQKERKEAMINYNQIVQQGYQDRLLQATQQVGQETQHTYTTMNAYAAMYGSGESEARRQTRIWERIEVAINELVGEQKGGI